MSSIDNLMAIPSRPRALSMPLPVVSTWHNRVVDGGVDVCVAHHNSIEAVRTFTTGAYGAAKQAAPPRGTPR